MFEYCDNNLLEVIEDRANGLPVRGGIANVIAGFGQVVHLSAAEGY